MFSERACRHREHLVLQWIIRYFEKWKSRSENIVFYNQNLVIFNENHQNHLILIVKHNVFRAWFSLFIILSFPMGKLKILKSENHVLEMLILTMNPSRFLMNSIKNQLISIAKHNVFRTRFSLPVTLSYRPSYSLWRKPKKAFSKPCVFK